MNSNRSPLGVDDSRLDAFFKFVSACAWIRQYDALLQVLAEYSHRLADFERLSILRCDENRQISRIVVIEDHSAREISNDEIQLSEMDLILQVLINGTESKSDTTMCIPMESADSMVGVLSLTAKDETHRDSEAQFVYFLADCLAGTFERLTKDGGGNGSVAEPKSIADARKTTIAATHRVSLRMSYLAQHDALTDLPNRLLLGDRLARALALSKRYGRRLAVLFLDLDGFKPINDSLGHAVGDQLLRQISDRLVRCVRSSDTVGRIGGDEFVILLAELEHKEDALVGANKIIAAVAAPILIAGQEICLTISIGVSIYPDDGEDADSLIQKADTAMYQAKAAGFGKCMFFVKHESPAPPPRELLIDTKEVTDV